MAKLIPATAKKVKALGINAKTEEEAREKLLEILNENGIDGMDEEDIDTLIEIAESFVEEGDGDSEEGADDDEETQNDKLAEEVEEETESDDDDSEEEDESDEFDDMDRTELKAYIKDNELNITVKKSMSDDDIRELIRAAVAENDEEDNEPEEEEEAKPAPKASKKSAEKPAPKKEEKKAAKDEKKSEKKEEKKAPAGKRGTKLDPKNNEDDREAFDVLKKLFPEDEFNYAWVASAGVTIKHKGVNSNRSLVLIENCSKQADGSIKCNLYLLTFNKQLEVLDEAGIEYETCWSGAPLIKGITLDEAVEIISGLLDNIMSSVKKIDKKLGENRKKMEENLEKKAPKKATKKAEPAPEEDDDDSDDEEEEEKPAPKKAVAKKSAVAAKKTVSKKK
jgi:hypothetical protein